MIRLKVNLSHDIDHMIRLKVKPVTSTLAKIPKFTPMTTCSKQTLMRMCMYCIVRADNYYKSDMLNLITSKACFNRSSGQFGEK